MLECPMMTCRLNEHTLSINNKYTKRAKRSRKNENLAYFDRTLHPLLCHFGDETDSTITIDSKRINLINNLHQSNIELWVFMSANSYFGIDIYTFFSLVPCTAYKVQLCTFHVLQNYKLFICLWFSKGSLAQIQDLGDQIQMIRNYYWCQTYLWLELELLKWWFSLSFRSYSIVLLSWLWSYNIGLVIPWFLDWSLIFNPSRANFLEFIRIDIVLIPFEMIHHFRLMVLIQFMESKHHFFV